MGRLFAARLAQAVVVVAIVTTLTFFLIHLAPGDPCVGEGLHETQRTAEGCRAQFGTDQPIVIQYAHYVRDLLRGNLGYSITFRAPVGTLIAAALPRTLRLAGLSLLLSIPLGIALGVAQAARRDSYFDRAVSALLGVVYAIPDFALAIILMLVLYERFGLFKIGPGDEWSAYQSGWHAWVEAVEHLALPVLTLTLFTTAIIARYQRTALLDVLPLDYIRTARAKGLSEARIVGRHALRGSLASVIALVGLLLPALVGGAFFIEYVFRWPGMGQLTLTALGDRDYDVLTGAVIVSAIVVTTGTVLADLLHAAVDPRIRAG